MVDFKRTGAGSALPQGPGLERREHASACSLSDLVTLAEPDFFNVELATISHSVDLVRVCQCSDFTSWVCTGSPTTVLPTPSETVVEEEEEEEEEEGEDEGVVEFNVEERQ